MPPDPAEGGGSGVAGVDESLYSRQLYVMGHEAQVCGGGGGGVYPGFGGGGGFFQLFSFALLM